MFIFRGSVILSDAVRRAEFKIDSLHQRSFRPPNREIRYLELWFYKHLTPLE